MSDPDMLSGLIAYLFREDILAHPMPPHRAAQLLQTIRGLLSEPMINPQPTKESVCAHGQTENNSSGNPGAAK